MFEISQILIHPSNITSQLFFQQDYDSQSVTTTHSMRIMELTFGHNHLLTY